MMRSQIFRESGLRFSAALPEVLSGGHPQIPLEDVRFVFGALLIEQLRLSLPVEPARIEGPISVADEAALVRAAAGEKRFPSLARVETPGRSHHDRIASGNFLIVQIRIEVIGDAGFQAVEIDVHEKGVPAGRDAGKGDGKQVGQGGPVEPVRARLHRREGKAQGENRLDALVKRVRLRLGRFQQLLPLGLSPQMPEGDLAGGGVILLPHQGGDRRSHLDAHRVALRREDAGVGRAVRRRLARPVSVPVQAVDANRVEGLQIPLAHSGEGKPVQPGIVRDEAHHPPPRLLGDAPLRHAEEADVEIVQPLSLGLPRALRRPVGFAQSALLLDAHAREAVVRRVAEDDENGRLALHPVGSVALLFEFGKGQGLVRPRLPARERVGEEHARALLLAERRAQFAQGEGDLQVRDDEGGGHDLEAENAPGRRLPHPRPRQRAQPPALEVGGDPPQNFGQIGARAAAGVENVDVLRRQPVGDAEIALERVVHAGDHVAHDFGRGVPDAEPLFERGVEGLQKRLVEIGNRLALVEAGEEGGPVHAVERGGRPVQRLHQVEQPEASGSGHLLKQGGERGDAQMPDRLSPVEPLARRVPRPKRPGGEHAVEEGLHDGRVEKARSALALEADAQGFFQRAPQGGQGAAARVDRFHAREAVPRVGGQQPGQILRLGDRRLMREGAGEVFDQPRPDASGEGARLLQFALEILRALRREPGVIGGGLHLHHAALGRLPFPGPALLQLPLRVESEIGTARALLRQLRDAEHLFAARPRRVAHRVQQVRERGIVGGLRRRPARGADALQLGEIGLRRRHQPGVRSAHAFRFRPSGRETQGGEAPSNVGDA